MVGDPLNIEDEESNYIRTVSLRDVLTRIPEILASVSLSILLTQYLDRHLLTAIPGNLRTIQISVFLNHVNRGKIIDQQNNEKFL